MFPIVKVSLEKLEPNDFYFLMMDVVPVDGVRYKFVGNRWVPSGEGSPYPPSRLYLHPDSPALGSKWMRSPVSFYKVKLTNDALDSRGNVSDDILFMHSSFNCD